MSKFKGGDRVVVSHCTGLNEKYNGSKGTVVRESKAFRPSVYVQMDDSDEHLYFDKELELLEEEKPMEYKTWGEMTREEKGELLLAHHDSKVIQSSLTANTWHNISEPMWYNEQVYRVKPEPVVETVVMYGRNDRQGDAQDWTMGSASVPWTLDTHKITFNVVDGVADCSSVKMEEV